MVLLTRDAPRSRRHAGRFWAMALGFGVIAACSSEPGPEPDALPEHLASCRELAAVDCALRALCAGTTFESEYGTQAECITRRATLCVGTWLAPGSGMTPDGVRTCAARLSDEAGSALSVQCEHWLEREVLRSWPAECRVKGELGQGAKCVADSQCTSGTCRPQAICGTCGEPSKLTQECSADAECEGGLACSKQVCSQPGKLKEQCAPGARCLPQYACIEGSCQLPPAKSQPCEPDGGPCTHADPELACSRQSKICEPLQLRGPVEACGHLADGTVARCAHGYTCKATSSPYLGSCVPIIEDGLSCEHAGAFVFGGPCRAPATCIDGLCQLRVGAACRGALP